VFIFQQKGTFGMLNQSTYIPSYLHFLSPHPVAARPTPHDEHCMTLVEGEEWNHPTWHGNAKALQMHPQDMHFFRPFTPKHPKVKGFAHDYQC
jgi:hypothetical protein